MEHGHTYAGAEAAGTSNAATGRRTTNARPQATRRHNIYANVHKALRACMGETLIAVGRMDPTDDVDVGLAVAQVRELLTLARMHLEKEDHFVHPAMEARRPGSAAHTAADHIHHVAAFGRLEDGIAAVERARGDARVDAATALYRDLALFVADNFVHMHTEEVDNNAALWAAYTDDEMLAIESAIVAAIPPDAKALFMRWMAPAIDPAERAAMFAHLRADAPAPVFAGMLASLAPHLRATDRRKLDAALAA
jgi:hypothetical protein